MSFRVTRNCSHPSQELTLAGVRLKLHRPEAAQQQFLCSSCALCFLWDLQLHSAFQIPTSVTLWLSSLLQVHDRKKVSNSDVYKLIILLKGTFWKRQKNPCLASAKGVSRRCLYSFHGADLKATRTNTLAEMNGPFLQIRIYCSIIGLNKNYTNNEYAEIMKCAIILQRRNLEMHSFHQSEVWYDTTPTKISKSYGLLQQDHFVLELYWHFYALSQPKNGNIVKYYISSSDSFFFFLPRS